MAASKGWIKSAFLQRQCYVVNRDVVCHLPPEAGHPPCIAARLKNPAYGMNGASRRWWNIVDKARCSYGMVPKRFFYHIPLEPMLVRTHWVTVQCATSEIVRATVECVYTTRPTHNSCNYVETKPLYSKRKIICSTTQSRSIQIFPTRKNSRL